MFLTTLIHPHRQISKLFFACCVCFSAILIAKDDKQPTQILLEDFESYRVGSTPTNEWRARNGDPKLVYTIASEKRSETQTNKYLQAKDEGQSIQLFMGKGWDIKEYPWIQWKWRVNEFPKGSNEVSGKNDSAAGIYIVFPKRWFLPETIKYVWSEKAPVGSIYGNVGRYPGMIIKTGTDDKGKWITMTRNVYEDFDNHFKRKPGKPLAIGFLSDANSTKSKAYADYDDVIVLKEFKEQIKEIKKEPTPKEVKKP